jgi:hypothetical protein
MSSASWICPSPSPSPAQARSASACGRSRNQASTTPKPAECSRRGRLVIRRVECFGCADLRAVLPYRSGVGPLGRTLVHHHPAQHLDRLPDLQRDRRRRPGPVSRSALEAVAGLGACRGRRDPSQARRSGVVLPDVDGGEHGVDGRGELASRSRLRNRQRRPASSGSMSRLRACWVSQAPVGWAVTPRMCTRRVVCSMTKKTYSRRRAMVSRWNRSQATMLCACPRRNVLRLTS